MDVRQHVWSLKGSVCYVLLTFSLVNVLSKSPSHDQNLRCCSPLIGLISVSNFRLNILNGFFLKGQSF